MCDVSWQPAIQYKNIQKDFCGLNSRYVNMFTGQASSRHAGPGICVYACELSVMLMQCDPCQRKRQTPSRNRRSPDWPLLHAHSGTAPLWRYYGLQRALFWLELWEVCVSLEWIMRIINNQVCVFGCERCLGCAKCRGAKATRGSHWTEREGSREDLYSSKGGVPGQTVPIIKMLTTSQRSTVSPALNFPFDMQM